MSWLIEQQHKCAHQKAGQRAMQADGDDDDLNAIRDAVAALCADFPGTYWRKFPEMRLCQIAPISTNLILSYIAEHVFGMLRSH